MSIDLLLRNNNLARLGIVRVRNGVVQQTNGPNHLT